jgi:hypothetical protein
VGFSPGATVRGSMKVTFICLANSRKLGGRCVAGIRTDGGGWIRPVSPQPSGTLSRRHCTLDNRNEANPLDVVEIEVTAARPEPHQPENWVLGRERWRFLDWIFGIPSWHRIGRVQAARAFQSLEGFLSSGPDLLGNPGDRVSYDHLKDKSAPASLELIQPSNVSWHITESSAGRRQTRAHFQLSGQHYDLPITDPQWEQRLSYLTYGTHHRAAADVAPDHRLLFTISLGEPFYGNYPAGECFKLVAAVLVLPKAPIARQKRSDRPLKEGSR